MPAVTSLRSIIFKAGRRRFQQLPFLLKSETSHDWSLPQHCQKLADPEKFPKKEY